MDQLNCFMCEQLVPDGLDGLVRHFNFNHGITISRGIRGAGFICAQNGCRRSFVHFYNLRRHIQNSHLADANPVANHNDPVRNLLDAEIDDEMEVGDGAIAIGNVENPANELQAEEVDEGGVDDEFNLKAIVIKMIGRFHSHGSMTGSMIKVVFEECEELLLNVHNSLKRRISVHMRPGQIINEAFINNINQLMEFDNPFEGLKNYDQQITALVENYGYIQPLEIPLGRRLDTALDSKSCTYIPKQVIESFQYVPIIDTLELILSSKDVRQAVSSEQPSPEGMLASFIDSEHFKGHPFFQKYKDAIRLRLYYDELEIVNPLGSKTGVHKLGGFYYQIGNLPAHMNSELSSIHILLLCYHADVQKYGFSKILSPFLNDLSRLESDEGILIHFKDEDYILRGSIESFCGDGLAVHEVYNLLGPSANKFCRSCLYSRNDLYAGSLEKGIERTDIVYREHLDLLKRTNYADVTKTETGMKGDCPLNQSRYFHISKNKVFDIMHDLLCGICPMVVKLVLHQYVVKDRIFDIPHLNGVISLFNYGYLEQTNKPSANFTEGMLGKREHSLSQKAMQMWCLIRALPFLLSNKIGEDDEYMGLILLLLRIMEIVFAPKINLSLLPYLDELIKDFTLYFLRLFPDVHLINKFHHLRHYSECIAWSGPLLHFYCMRFEAKHSELKLRAQNVHNFKNPPKTLIRVSQCVQSVKWSGADVKIERLEVSCGKVKEVIATLSREYLLERGYANDDPIFCAKSVIVNGVEFRKSLFVVLEKATVRDDNLLLFGRIEEIVVLQNNRVFLLTSICRTLCFDTALIAYNVALCSNAQFQFIEPSALPYYKPMCYWKKLTSDDLFISLRHIIL